MRFFQQFFLIAAIAGFAAATSYADELPLFMSDAVIDVTFEAPMDTIVGDAEKRPEVEGLLRYTEEDGRKITLHLKMNTRGKSRLAYCQFPPLKINLKKSETDGTLFEGQNKLKLVTRCRSGDAFERYLQQEFGIYGAFNALSGYSFRVRTVNATYHDSSGKRDDEIQTGYFIETDKEVAARYGMEDLDIKKIKSAQLDPAHASKLALFQYLIGNTDWSLLQGPPGDICCHNNKLIVKSGSEDGWILLPFDFDQAGLINTRYSSPSETLGIRSVRQRVYRGRCRHNDQLENTIAIFNEKRADIETALLPPILEGRSRKNAVKYIDEFYEIINDPKKLQKKIVKDCVGS